MLESETERFGNAKRNFVIFTVLAIMIVASNILVYIGLSNQINSLQPQRFPTIQTIYGTLEQRRYPRFYEDPPSEMVYVVSPTPNDSYPYYLSERGNPITYLNWLEIMDIHVGDKIEVDGLVWYRSDRWGDKTYMMFDWFSMRK